ncbi:MAG TPA: sigma-54 dependent transcriptional regulator [Thermoanaerobaculia bacterium]|nr:sigma-54 dependent transcriptional regulator [Thermoanaerobaculia bacterium]
MKKRRVLVIDDERAIRQTLSQVLADEGYEVESVADGVEGLDRIRRERFDLVFLDVWLKDKDGLAILSDLGEKAANVPVVKISGHANVETAVRAVKSGAYDFLEKPLSLERVLVTAQKAIDHRDLRAEVARFREKATGEQVLIGEPPAIVRLREQILQVAPTDARVLITGESGTGKEIVARAIHRHSQRRQAPLVEVNCAAIPEELIESELFGHVRGSFTGASAERAGKFEEADGASIFLDEVADMSARTQAKVLRALQEGRFTRVGGTKTIESDARVISATNKALPEEIRAGRFREDLYFRLAVVPLSLPPLRDRRADVPELARHFLREAAQKAGQRPKAFSDPALKKLCAYAWPGNVRELKNLVERLMIMSPGDTIDLRDLPVEIVESDAIAVPADFSTLRQARDDFERRFILTALRKNRGNVSRTAEELGVERSHFYRKLRSYGIDVERE